MDKGAGRQSGEVMGVYDLHSCHFMCVYFTPNSLSCIAQCKKYSFLQVDYISIKWFKKIAYDNVAPLPPLPAL